MDSYRLVGVLGELTRDFAHHVRMAVKENRQLYLGCTDALFIGCDQAAREVIKRLIDYPESLQSNHIHDQERMFRSLEEAKTFSDTLVRPHVMYIVIDPVRHRMTDLVRPDGVSLLDPKNDRPYRPKKKFLDLIMEREGSFILYSTFGSDETPVFFSGFECSCKHQHTTFFATHDTAMAMEEHLRFSVPWGNNKMSVYHALEIKQGRQELLRALIDPASRTA